MEAGSTCAICLSPIKPDEGQVRCPSCQTPYHAECWNENRGCAIYGCPQVPPTEKRDEMEIPASFWGKENKSCPACGGAILAAAVRCHYCGATFASSQPEDTLRFRSRVEFDQRAPVLRKAVTRFFIFSLIPFTAPFAALFGGIWYGNHRREVERLPALYTGLGRIALWVGIGQTSLIVLMGLLFAALHTP